MAEASPRTAKTSGRTGRTASREVRRRQLIEATIDSIAKHGISGTTVNTVTGFAGLSAGIVNFHFKNKENLFRETLRQLAEEHRDQWRRSVRKPDLTPQARLLAIVDAHFHPRICTRKKLAVWFAFYGETGHRSAYREIVSEIDDERWKVSTEILSEIVAEGNYAGISADRVAETLEGLYDGFWLNRLIYPSDFSRNDAKKRIREFLGLTFPQHFGLTGAT